MCCAAPKHTGGRIGMVLEGYVAPQLVKKPMAAVVCALFCGLCGICAWQASFLAVQDTERRFLPDDSYLLTTLKKSDEYFGSNGKPVNIMTVEGDYFASQKALVGIGAVMAKVEDVMPPTTDAYRNWADAFRRCGAQTLAAFSPHAESRRPPGGEVGASSNMLRATACV